VYLSRASFATRAKADGLVTRQRAQDLLVLREPPGLGLREDGHAVANHVELTLAAGDVRRGDVIRP